jgi:hypothetical protein
MCETDVSQREKGRRAHKGTEQQISSEAVAAHACDIRAELLSITGRGIKKKENKVKGQDVCSTKEEWKTHRPQTGMGQATTIA